jgi:ankyrin repeat protein
MATKDLVEQLFEAIALQNLQQVEQLLQFGLSPNSINEQGRSAIAMAASLGDVPMIEALAAAGAELNPKTDYSRTNDQPIASFLDAIAAFPVPTGSVTDQPIPILLCGKKGTYYGTDNAALPVDECADIQAIDHKLKALGFQLLGKVTFSHFVEMSSYAYVLPGETICASIMRTASGLGGMDFVTCFADDAFLTTTSTRLSIADYSAQKLFRRSYPSLDIADLMAQHQAAIAEFSTHHGAAQPLFANLHAIALMVDIYLQRQDANPMHDIATLSNALDIISDLIDDDPEWNSDYSDFVDQTSTFTEPFTDEEDDFELEDDEFDHYIDIEEDLIEDYADNNIQEEEDFAEPDTPLIVAVLNHQAEAAKALLKLGANPNPTGWKHTSALIMAASKGQLETVCALLEAGAAIEWESASGFTALTIAAYEGQAAIVQKLIQAGADIHACTCGGYGNNAFDFAHLGLIECDRKGKQHLEIIALLETIGAKRSWETTGLIEST